MEKDTFNNTLSKLKQLEKQFAAENRSAEGAKGPSAAGKNCSKQDLQLEVVKTELGRKDQALARLQTELADLKKTLGTARADTAGLRRELNAREQVIATLQADLKRFRGGRERVTKDAGGLREQPLLAEVEGLKKLSALKDLEISKLTRQLSDAEEKKNSLKAEIAAGLTEIKELNVFTRSAASALKDRDAELRKLTERLEKMKGEITAQNDEIRRLTQELAASGGGTDTRKLKFWKKKP